MSSMGGQWFLEPIDQLFFREDGMFAYFTAAVVILVLLLLVRRLTRIRMDDAFFFSLIPFILFGAVIRVSVDAGLLPYERYSTVPGIYISVGLLTFFLILLLDRLRAMPLLPYAGAILFAYQFLFLVGSLRYVFYGYLTLALVFIGTLAGIAALRLLRTRASAYDYAFILSHMLDGAATYVAVEVFHSPGISYIETQPVTRMLMGFFGTMAFYMPLKLIFATGLVAVLERYAAFAPLLRLPKKILREDRNIILFVLLMLGLGPGFRNLLRVIAGV